MSRLYKFFIFNVLSNVSWHTYNLNQYFFIKTCPQKNIYRKSITVYYLTKQKYVIFLIQNQKIFLIKFLLIYWFITNLQKKKKRKFFKWRDTNFFYLIFLSPTVNQDNDDDDDLLRWHGEKKKEVILNLCIFTTCETVADKIKLFSCMHEYVF